MALKGFIEGNAAEGFRVGAKRPESDYYGPVARVSADADWLNIVTDDYEGRAMLNIEALPALRKALAQISKARRDTDRNPKGEKP